MIIVVYEYDSEKEEVTKGVISEPLDLFDIEDQKKANRFLFDNHVTEVPLDRYFFDDVTCNVSLHGHFHCLRLKYIGVYLHQWNAKAIPDFQLINMMQYSEMASKHNRERHLNDKKH